MTKNHPTLLRYFWYLTFAVIVGAVMFAVFSYFTTRYNFQQKVNERIKNNSSELVGKVDVSLIYVENFVNLIATRISQQNTSNPSKIASILGDVRPKIEDDKFNIFTWTLFDFVNPDGQVLAASTLGILGEDVIVTPEQRSWMIDAKKTPWKFHIAKSDVGIVSGESIIPIGFGVTGSGGKFLGIISLGVNTQKLQRMLEVGRSDSITSFALLNADYSIITASQNFDSKDKNEFTQELGVLLKSRPADDDGFFVKLNGDSFFCLKVPHYPSLIVISGVNKNATRTAFISEVFPRIANTLYLTFFFLLLLYIFRVKLLSPVLKLAGIANEIGCGNTNVKVFRSDFAEVNYLASSIESTRRFVEKQQEEKNFAESANHNKTEFLASTAHELKNIVAGIIGLAEVVKMSLAEDVEGKKFSSEEIEDNRNSLRDITRLGEELASFITDITDINQAQTGEFKIEEEDLVNVKDVLQRAEKLMKARAIRAQKQLLVNFSSQNDQDFLVEKLDARRVKQVFVNLISNSVKYANSKTKIEVLLESLSQEEAAKWRKKLRESIEQNSDIEEKRKNSLLDLVKKSRPKIIFSIQDEGIGMSEDEIKIALQKYGKLEHKEVVDSTGLGLPIVKHLVELQGGMLLISSQKNVGTKVMVVF